jgi:hypothetical protein
MKSKCKNCENFFESLEQNGLCRSCNKKIQRKNDRIHLVMSLVIMKRNIDETKDAMQRAVLNSCLYDIMKDLKLNEREKQIYLFECEERGV